MQAFSKVSISFSHPRSDFTLEKRTENEMKEWNTDPLSTVFLQPCSILLEFSWPCFNSLSGSGFEMVHTLQRIMFYISICLPGKRVQIKRNNFSGSLEGRVSSAFCLTELCSQPRHYRRFRHWLIVKFLEILNRFSFALACFSCPPPILAMTTNAHEFVKEWQIRNIYKSRLK